MDRLRREKAFLISFVLHGFVLMILTSLSSLAVMPELACKPTETPEPVVRMVLPPLENLRQIVRNEEAPAPRSPLLKPFAPMKDRISIGPPSAERARVLVLTRDQELTNKPPGDGGEGDASGAAKNGTAADRPAPDQGAVGGEAEEDHRRPAFNVPGRSRDGWSASDQETERSIASSFRRWQRSLERRDLAGSGGGGGARQIGPLFFDPAGADFTRWINHFKNEVYRNWIVPKGALIGFKGRVDLRFTVDREGRLSDLRLVRSSGTGFLDRAAANALIGSRFLPLPQDYRPLNVSMNVSFFYNEEPRPS
jgi:TonB family protein